MKTTWMILFGLLIVLVCVGLYWFVKAPVPQPMQPGDADADQSDGPVWTIGMIPESDIFLLYRKYDPLAQYLSARLGRRVEIKMVSTYEGVLRDLAERQIDAAFLGSLVATLAIDRLDAKVLVKPVAPDGSSTYCGVIIVREDSSITDLDHLAGKSMAMVKMTLAGNLFPFCVLNERGMLDRPDCPRGVWVGTHDDVVEAVILGRVSAGAVKCRRLSALLAANPQWRIRRLASSELVPNNALVIRADLADELGPPMSQALLDMHNDSAGRKALTAMDVVRFVPCKAEEYTAVYQQAESLGAQWHKLGIEGAPPVRNRAATAPGQPR